MIKEVLNRRIPQILGSYVVAGTSLVLFMDWLSARYEFPEYFVTIALFGIVSIIPSVLILAYFHGAPGKDQWNKLEKVGIPINIVFIGLMIVVGNIYGWWIDGIEISQIDSKRLIIAPITSDKENINHALEKVNKYANDPEIQLDVLSKIEKNNIYDELITYLKSSYINNNIEYYTKYQLAEESNKRGEKTREYTFKYIRMRYAGGAENPLDLYKIMQENDNSIFNYREKTFSDFAYFPLLYKIIYPDKDNEYFIYHTLTYMEISSKGQDTTHMYRDPVYYKTVASKDLVGYMADYIFKEYIGYIMVNEGTIIEVIDDKKILFKYDQSKNDVQKRMILDAKREYIYRESSDDFDDFINKRLDDLISYEYYVDRMPESKYYIDYYNNKGPNKNFIGLISLTKDELNMINNGTHPFYKNEGQPGMRYGYPIDISIRVKVEEVYDSTAIAIVYTSKDPNIKLRVGDFIKY